MTNLGYTGMYILKRDKIRIVDSRDVRVIIIRILNKIESANVKRKVVDSLWSREVKIKFSV